MVLKEIETLSDDSPPRPTGSEQVAAKAQPKTKSKAKAKPKAKADSPTKQPRAKSKAKAKAKAKAEPDDSPIPSKGLKKRPAAAPKGSPMKRPATSKRPLAANKYMYTTQGRLGTWGIKTRNKEVVRAGLMFHVNPSLEVKPASGVSDEKIEEIAASWFEVVSASIGVRHLRKQRGWRS